MWWQNILASPTWDVCTENWEGYSLKGKLRGYLHIRKGIETVYVHRTVWLYKWHLTFLGFHFFISKVRGLAISLLNPCPSRKLNDLQWCTETYYCDGMRDTALFWCHHCDDFPSSRMSKLGTRWLWICKIKPRKIQRSFPPSPYLPHSSNAHTK